MHETFFGRRAALLLVPAGLAMGASPAFGAPGSCRFRVLREGSAIGTHTVSATGEGGNRRARTEVSIAVRLAGFTVFSYAHQFEEAWQDGRLVAVASRLERQGRRTEMQGRAEGDALILRGSSGTHRLPRDAAPLSWWDPTTLERPLFNASTGQPLQVQLARLSAPGGGFRLRLSGDAEGTATYDRSGAWIAHAMKGEDGSDVTYERT